MTKQLYKIIRKSDGKEAESGYFVASNGKIYLSYMVELVNEDFYTIERLQPEQKKFSQKEKEITDEEYRILMADDVAEKF